ncbi:CDP-glycerol glycerophosphotransferase family protein [Lederbergia panacisoli]|uniref:CDP-glycerol glycerophosphotransferase family protein n=1 Tax=Lederbergia panacisoli TaxID=1255251 RepID=UPI00214C8470|nr:CDP-glycerol glycerophosphotransferase family protein [Lederbergia panacisoli]MCR2821414.1 CDP-glycerol glycerophosphotransferase family protein [Lederbergia panacisoli]
MFTLKELEKQTDGQVVVLKTSQCKVDFDEASRIVLDFEPRHFFQWIKSIFHLATSTHIFVDNYFGFLAVTTFRKNVSCIQLWHAAGAIKQFGLKDPSIRGRSKRALQRFKKVYDRIDYTIVGSEKMADIFRQSFGLSDKHILRSGIPRTDFFFDSAALAQVREKLTQRYPVIQEKKVILYAPTFRDHELHVSSLNLDIAAMYKALKDEYVLFLRIHPAVKVELNNQYPEFVYDVSKYEDINHLLVVTDLLISDYSSIPFEYSLLQRPMIFFAYDLHEYEKSRGFWEDYNQLVPGPVVKDTSSLIDIIASAQYDLYKVVEFSHEWNQYSRGDSSEKLIQTLYKARAVTAD